MTRPFDLSVYLVTDSGMCAGRGVVATVRDAVANGVSFVQVRDPDASDEDFLALARAVVAAVGGEVPVVLNDRVDLVAASGADGAHVGQGDLDPVAARGLLGPEAILGLSVQTREHVNAALALPPGTIDYLGVGPVWSQATKPDAAAPSGEQAGAELIATANAAGIPSVVIGGVDATRIGEVRRMGAAGGAIVSAICAAPDPAAATAAIRTAWEEAQ